MKAVVFSLALLIGQMNTLQSKPVVHLQPHRDAIEIGLGGKFLELINAPATVHLPTPPPKSDGAGNPWSLDVKNLGSNAVTIVGKGPFSVQVSVGQTIHIYSNGSTYLLKH
jgi:hypothetical protein